MADERFERVINELPLHFTVVTTFDRENVFGSGAW